MTVTPFARILTIAAVLAAVACSGTETEPNPRVVAAVAVIPGNRTLLVGESFAYEGRVLDADGRLIDDQAIGWTSSNPAVASVSTAGIVQAIAPGVATISAASSGKVGTSQLVVMDAPAATIAVAPAAPMMIVGETQTLVVTAKDANGRVLTNPSIEWSSDAPAVADVDATGRVTAKAPGSAAIAARSGQVTGVAYVTVNRVPVASITASPTGLVLGVSQTKQLTAVTRDALGNVLTGRIVNWTSDHPAIATVNGAGLVTAVGPGYATIVVASEGVTFGVAVTVTPDDVGFNIVYTRTATNGDQQLFLLDPSTGNAPTVINAGSVSRQPSPSPTGSRIAFAVSMTQPNTTNRIDDIYAVDRNGMNMKQLTTAAGVDDHPAWSPNGQRIAYRHIDPLGARGDIWVMNADGTSQTNLTADLAAGTMVGPGAWSADGQRIAFSTSQTGVAGTTNGIWIMNADGSDKQMLTSTLTGFDASPTWSPDGLTLAFVRYYAGDADISFVDASGGPVSRLALIDNQSSPAWSPDGALIVFTQPYGARDQLYTVRPNGTDVRLRTFNLSWGGGSDAAWIVR